MINSVVASALLNVLGKAQCQAGSKPYCILSALLTREHSKLCYMEAVEGRCVVVIKKFSFRDTGGNSLVSSHCCVHH